jgi:hypothetical protein
MKSDGKLSQLRNLVSSIQADIVIGTESWLNPTIRDAEVFPEGFKAYRRDRTDGKGGGVFLLISKKYDSSEPYSLTVSFSLFMSPRLKSPPIHRCAPFAVGILVMKE